LQGGWRDRTEELQKIIEQVTRRATESLIAQGVETILLPWQSKPSDALLGGSRYVGESDQPNLAMGMPSNDRPSEMRAEGIDPPFWLRWHRSTPDAREVIGRLNAAGLRPVKGQGAILVWLPLRLKPDAGLAERQTATLVEQVIEAYLATRGSTDNT
jgi:hypothetical protein